MDGTRFAGLGGTMRRVAALLVLALPVAAPGAQPVRGTVLQPDSATRAVGVVIVAADANGNVVARALSGDLGDFDMRLPGAGTYIVRLLRVGYRPTTLPPLAVPPDGVAGLRLVLGAEAVVLSTVTVRSDNVCGSTDDAGRVVAQLWEQARTALTAAELSVGSSTLVVEWQSFQFLMDREASRARDQSVLLRRGATERPFVSASADSLARDGYVVRDRTDIIYRAPDAAALLSDQFAATHCFQVEAISAAHPQWVSVAFRPTPERGKMGEITGVLWLDRATTELRMLEFRYTNLPPEGDVPAVGGYVEYVRLATGQWLVARWAIRTPHMVRQRFGGAAVPGGGGVDRVVLSAIGVTGGELLSASRGRDPLYEADRSTIAQDNSDATVPAHGSLCGAAQRPGTRLGGVVTNGPQRAPGALVQVSWKSGDRQQVTTLSTVTDRRGEYRIPCVARGVPLVVSAVSGDAHAGPEPVPPIQRSELAVDIEIGPAVTRKP